MFCRKRRRDVRRAKRTGAGIAGIVTFVCDNCATKIRVPDADTTAICPMCGADVAYGTALVVHFDRSA